MSGYTSVELAEKLQEAIVQSSGAVSNDPRVMQAWREEQRQLEQQLWNLQQGRFESR